MPFNTPLIATPPLDQPWVTKDGYPDTDLINWFLITLLPAVSQSPSVFTSSGPVFDETDNAAIALTPLPLGSVPSGLYRVSAFVRVTAADGVSSSVTPRISFPSDGVTCTATGTANASDAIDRPNSSTFVIQVDAPGPISIETLYASNTPNAMSYRLIATVERVQ